MAASLQRESASQIPVRFCVGDTVNVLRSIRLPKVEEVIGTGVIEAVKNSEMFAFSEPLYAVSGFPCLRDARTLRLVRRAR